MFINRHQSAGRNHDVQITDKSFDNEAKLKYSGTVTSQNYIHEEIKSRLNSGNACCHPVQNRSVFPLLS
jgi:hypothetical protein